MRDELRAGSCFLYKVSLSGNAVAGAYKPVYRVVYPVHLAFLYLSTIHITAVIHKEDSCDTEETQL